MHFYIKSVVSIQLLINLLFLWKIRAVETVLAAFSGGNNFNMHKLAVSTSSASFCLLPEIIFLPISG